MMPWSGTTANSPGAVPFPALCGTANACQSLFKFSCTHPFPCAQLQLQYATVPQGAVSCHTCTDSAVHVQEQRDATITAVAASMLRLLQQVDALAVGLSESSRDAASALLASNMHDMDLALDDADAMRGLSIDLAAVLSGDVSSRAYVRAAAELTCVQERRVDTQVPTRPCVATVEIAELRDV